MFSAAFAARLVAHVLLPSAVLSLGCAGLGAPNRPTYLGASRMAISQTPRGRGSEPRPRLQMAEKDPSPPTLRWRAEKAYRQAGEIKS